MENAAAHIATSRRPRFHRADISPAFRVTEGDLEIIRQIARHRFLRSTHVAALVGRSLDRTNDRLCHLYHAGYLDRPRAQLDHYSAGSASMVYALTGRGARLLRDRDGSRPLRVELSRRNRTAGRAFIEHQLEIADFEVVAQLAAEAIAYHYENATEIAARLPHTDGHPFAVRVRVTHRGAQREIGLVPDGAMTITIENGMRRNFLIEIDRGTMPIKRMDFSQTSIDRKLRSYLSAHAARLFTRKLRWKNFRVLFVTTDAARVRSMIEALRAIQPANAVGSSLFLFASRDGIAADPLSGKWRDASGQIRRLIQ